MPVDDLSRRAYSGLANWRWIPAPVPPSSAEIMKLKVVVHQAEEGGFWAEVPALPGCVTEGDTLEETLANVREAAEGWLEVSATRTPPDPEAQLVEIEL